MKSYTLEFKHLSWGWHSIVRGSNQQVVDVFSTKGLLAHVEHLKNLIVVDQIKKKQPKNN